jgi:hypothetical protein
MKSEGLKRPIERSNCSVTKLPLQPRRRSEQLATRSTTEANGGAKDLAKALPALLERSGRGDLKARDEQEAIFVARPEIRRAVAEAGDLAQRAEERWMKVLAGDDVVEKELYRIKIEALRNELAGPNPSPLERLLVDRIIVCWIQVHHADLIAAQNAASGNLRWGTYVQRRQDRAQRRYLSAMKALANVRRLLVPSVQVNIAEQQVNVAQNALPEA